MSQDNRAEGYKVCSPIRLMHKCIMAFLYFNRPTHNLHLCIVMHRAAALIKYSYGRVWRTKKILAELEHCQVMIYRHKLIINYIGGNKAYDLCLGYNHLQQRGGEYLGCSSLVVKGYHGNRGKGQEWVGAAMILYDWTGEEAELWGKAMVVCVLSVAMSVVQVGHFMRHQACGHRSPPNLSESR